MGTPFGVGTAKQWLAGSAAVVLGAAAFFGINTTRPPAVEVPEPLGLAAGEYVALGDSYSAGEGLGSYRPETAGAPHGTNRCHRSVHAYGSILGGPGFVASADFAACSGARMANTFEVVQLHDDLSVGAVQVDGVSAAPDVVTLTMSGNDAEFAEILGHCARHLGCLDEQWMPSTFVDDGESVPQAGLTLREAAELEIDEIRSSLTAMLDQLESHFPDARVVILGYPRLMPLAEMSDAAHCRGAFRAAYSQAERTGLRDLGDQLNGAISDSAAAAGVEYVHVADVFGGHEACGVDGSWIEFGESLMDVTTYRRPGKVTDGLFHPNVDGQRMLARVAACYLDVNGPGAPDPQQGFAEDDVYDCAVSDRQSD